MEHLSQLLVDAAGRHGERVALSLDDVELTFAQLREAAVAVAADLRRRGLRAGDRVALVLPNVPAFAVAFYGAQLADLVVVPINPMCKEREIAYFLEDSGARVVFAYDGEVADTVEAGVGRAADRDGDAGAEDAGAVDSGVAVWRCDERGPLGLIGADASPQPTRSAQDTAVILYTSGTTGVSKGAELTHRNLVSNARTTAAHITQIDEIDVIMGCLPLFHCFGLTCAMNAAFSVGARLTLIPRFDPDRALAVMKRDAVTVFAGVPTMYSALLNAAGDKAVPSLRSCISGGASLPGEVLRAFEAEFDCIILEGYGLSETSPAASFNVPESPRKVGSVGRALPGVEMRVVDAKGVDVPDGEVGEIVYRGPQLMAGYWQNPTGTADAFAGGWFHSGDLVRRDEEGFIYVVDRAKDMIISGGENIYCAEVENALFSHPRITEAAIIGRADAKWGEVPVAVVVVADGGDLTVEELEPFLNERLARYKHPKDVVIVDELPRNAGGKVVKPVLRADFGSKDAGLHS